MFETERLSLIVIPIFDWSTLHILKYFRGWLNSNYFKIIIVLFQHFRLPRQVLRLDAVQDLRRERVLEPEALLRPGQLQGRQVQGRQERQREDLLGRGRRGLRSPHRPWRHPRLHPPPRPRGRHRARLPRLLPPVRLQGGHWDRLRQQHLHR